MGDLWWRVCGAVYGMPGMHVTFWRDKYLPDVDDLLCQANSKC